MTALTPTQFREIEQQLHDRRHAYQSRKMPQPLIRLFDKDMQLIARITIPETWECEEIAHDNGYARIDIAGKDNDWLREILVFKTKPAEDLHITIDPDPSKPHDWKNRWGGKIETISDVETKGKPTVTTITAVSNRIHFRHILMAAMPLTPHAVQIPKMFLWGGPCVSACASAVFANLFRIYTLNGWWPIPRNMFDPYTWINNLSPLNWPVQVMPVRVLTDQSRWITIGARWQDAETVLTPAMKDAGVICHAYSWMGKSACSGCAADCSGDSAPYEAFGNLKEQLKPTRACVILSFEDQSGVSGPTGTAADGLINLFAVTLDDIFTETLLSVDGDGDGETDPFFRKILGVAPKRPPFVYRDTGYGGVIGRTTVVHKTKAITIVVGGRSPGWVWPLRVTPEGPGPAKAESIKQYPSESGTASRRSRKPSPRSPVPQRRSPGQKVSTTSIRASSTTPCWPSCRLSIRSVPQLPESTPATSTSSRAADSPSAR